MVSRILVPTDGSKIAQQAARYAVNLAKKVKADILLLSVIDIKLFTPSQAIPAIASPTHLIEPIADYLRQAAKTYMEEIEKLCKKSNIRSKVIMRLGHPVEEIIKEAKKSKADIIIMGSHGKSAIKAAVLGSTTFGVIQKDIKIPVLIVRR